MHVHVCALYSDYTAGILLLSKYLHLQLLVLLLILVLTFSQVNSILHGILFLASLHAVVEDDFSCFDAVMYISHVQMIAGIIFCGIYQCLNLGKSLIKS